MKTKITHVIIDNSPILPTIFKSFSENENFLKIVGYIKTNGEIRWLLPWEATTNIDEALRKESRAEKYESTWNKVNVPIDGTPVNIPRSCAPNEKRLHGRAIVIGGRLSIDKY